MENPVCGKQAKILAECRWEKVYNNQNQHYITSNLQICLFSDSVHICECIAVRGYFILNLSLTVIKKQQQLYFRYSSSLQSATDWLTGDIKRQCWASARSCHRPALHFSLIQKLSVPLESE